MFALLEIEKYCSCAYCSSHRSNETILVSYIFRSMHVLALYVWKERWPLVFYCALNVSLNKNEKLRAL